MKKPGFFDNPIFISLSIVVIIVVWVSSNMNWGENRWHKLLRIDGVGYYSYLPAVFIYNDLSFRFYDGVEKNNAREELDCQFRVNTPSGTINKYFAGTAICILPFFWIAHLLSLFSGQISDGYSYYYLLSVQISALFYLILGLLFLSEILQIYGVSIKNRAVILPAIVFGTNLFYYVVHEPFMSHVYSFAIINLFVLSLLKYVTAENRKWIFIAAISLSFALLIRPVNFIVILSIPFLLFNIKTPKELFLWLKKDYTYFIGAFFLFAAIASIQLIIYKIQTGNFIVYSYEKENLDLTNPHIIDFLFSYRKGFFLWAPLMFFSLFGLRFIVTRNLNQLMWWLGFIICVSYVLSSWWMWYYGGSFGSRVMIDYLVFFAIPLGLLLQKTNYKKVVLSVIVVLCLFTQVQTFQYAKGYIHWSDMNKEWYWDNFLRIDKVLNKDQKAWGKSE